MTEAEFLKLSPDNARAVLEELFAADGADRAEAFRTAYIARWPETEGGVFSDPTGRSRSSISLTAVGAAADVNEGDGLALLGWFFLVGGLALMICSFFYDPSVSTEGSMIGDTYIPGRDVANMAKLNVQLMICLVGVALTISGSVLVAVRRGAAAVLSRPV